MKCGLRQWFFRVVAACKADSVKHGSEKQHVTALAGCVLAPLPEDFVLILNSTSDLVWNYLLMGPGSSQDRFCFAVSRRGHGWDTGYSIPPVLIAGVGGKGIPYGEKGFPLYKKHSGGIHLILTIIESFSVWIVYFLIPFFINTVAVIVNFKFFFLIAISSKLFLPQCLPPVGGGRGVGRGFRGVLKGRIPVLNHNSLTWQQKGCHGFISAGNQPPCSPHSLTYQWKGKS